MNSRPAEPMTFPRIRQENPWKLMEVPLLLAVYRLLPVNAWVRAIHKTRRD